tara:strand:+ start:3266 stop:6724 length:3459 start_codon:yes stop_codon:yes gene_type:complete
MILQLKTETSPGVFIYKPLDVFEDFEVTYNHQFEDYSTLSGRKIPYSNKFKIPTTPNNRVLCGLPVDANYPVSRDVDGKMYYSNGLIAFDFICSIEGQQIDTLQPYIEISVIDIISHALKELGKWKMSDFFADVNNTQRRYVDLTTDTWVYGSGNLTNTTLDEMFTFPFYNFNNKNLMFAYDPMRKLSQIQPTFTLWKLIESIFNFVGISVESDFLKLDNQLYPGIKANELGLTLPMVPTTTDSYSWAEDARFSGSIRNQYIVHQRLPGVPNMFPTSSFVKPNNFLLTSIPGESLKFNYDIASDKYDKNSPLGYTGIDDEYNNGTAGSFCATVAGDAKVTLTNLPGNTEPIYFYIAQLNNAPTPSNDFQTPDGNTLAPNNLPFGVTVPDMDIRMVVADDLEILTDNWFDKGWANTGTSYNINESVICGNAVYDGIVADDVTNDENRSGIRFRMDFDASTEMLLKLEANKRINIVFIIAPKLDATVSILCVWENKAGERFDVTTEISQGYIKHIPSYSLYPGWADVDLVEAKYVWSRTPPLNYNYIYPFNIAMEFTEATSMPTGFVSGTNSTETVMNTAKIDMSESMKTVKDYKLIDIVKMVSQRFNLKFYSTADGVIHLDTNKNRLSGLSYNIDHLTDTGVSAEFTDNEIGVVNIKDTNPSFYEEDFNRLDNNIVSDTKREETTLTFNSSIVNSKMFKDEYDESSFGLLATGLSSNHFGVADRKQASASDLKPVFTFLKEKESELWFPVNECSLSSYNYDPDFADPQIDAAFYNSFRKGTYSTSLEAVAIHETGFDLVSFIDDEAPSGTRNLYMQTWFQNIMDRVNDESVILSPDIYVSEATLKNLMNFPTILYKGTEWEYQGLNNYPLSNKKGGMTSVKLIKKKVWEREGVPTMPLNHVITSNTIGNEITTSWDASTDDVAVTGYKMYLDGSLVFTNTGLLSYTYTGLNLGQSYIMGVSAIDVDGNESETNRITEIVQDTTAPGVPLNVTYTDITCHDVTVSWNEPFDAIGVDSYNIYDAGVLIASLASNVYSYDYTGYPINTVIQTGVSAKDAAGNESALVVSSQTTSGICRTPFDVSALYANQFGACNSTDTFSVYYHNGINTFPVAGDNVAVNVEFTVSPSNGYYRMPGASSVAFIEGGMVTSITTGC